MDGEPAGRWREARRQRLLEAAARVFASRPFEQASMDDIAFEAAIGKPTIYRYFPSKEALFEAVFVAALDELEARLAQVRREAAAPATQLRAMVEAIIPTFRDHLVSLRALGESAAAVDQSRRRIFRERRTRIERMLAELIDEGARRGAFKPGRSERVAQLLIGMIWSGLAAAGPAGLAEDIVDLVVNGIRADSPGLSADDGNRRHEPQNEGRRGPDYATPAPGPSQPSPTTPKADQSP